VLTDSQLNAGLERIIAGLLARAGERRAAGPVRA